MSRIDFARHGLRLALSAAALGALSPASQAQRTGEVGGSSAAALAIEPDTTAAAAAATPASETTIAPPSPAGTPAPKGSTLPRCSRTIVDHCTQPRGTPPR